MQFRAMSDVESNQVNYPKEDLNPQPSDPAPAFYRRQTQTVTGVYSNAMAIACRMAWVKPSSITVRLAVVNGL